MLLTLQSVHKHFGGVRAVNGVSFSLQAPEFTALIGPNGAGKTTLFGVIAGQHRADGGRVLFEDGEIGRQAPHRLALRGIGRTFQSAQVFASMRVVENLQLALAVAAGRQFDVARTLWSFGRDAAEELLERVGLAQQAGRPAADLAYGDLKRLELGLALAGRPRLLLMDEPTAGMSAAERAALMDLVRTLADASGLTVLFTEHSMDVVFGYARRVLVLSEGRLVADGTPEQVRADPAAQKAYFDEAALQEAAAAPTSALPR